MKKQSYLNDNILSEFSEQSEFSATIESICSSEDMLYKILPGRPYFEDDSNIKKSVTFGDITINECLINDNIENNSSNDNAEELLLTMFTNHNKDNDTTIDVRSIETKYSNNELSEENNNNNNNLELSYVFPSKDEKIIFESNDYESNDYEVENGDARITTFNDITGHDPAIEKYYEEATETCVTPTKLTLPSNDFISTSSKIKTENENNELSINVSPKTIRMLRRYKRQNTSLRKQNKELIDNNHSLCGCILTQQQAVNNYEILVNDLQEKFSNLKINYDICVKKNCIKDDNLNKAIQALGFTQMQLETVKKVQLLNEIEAKKSTNIPNIESYLEGNLRVMRKLILNLQFKNRCLQDINNLLCKKMNGLYRFTIAPALYILKQDSEDLEDLMQFDTTNKIQKFLDSKYEIFQSIQSLNLQDFYNINDHHYDTEEYEETEEINEKQRKTLMKEIGSYFDRLNVIISDQFVELSTETHHFI